MNKTFLEAVIEVCDIHVDRIQYALSKISKHFPLDAEVVEKLTNDDLAFFDLFINRFGKLQDYIGAKLLGEILKAAQIDVGLTVIDKIYQLQKLGVNIDKDVWIELRATRNQATHEYPEQPQIVANHLNKLYEKNRLLLDIYNELKLCSARVSAVQ